MSQQNESFRDQLLGAQKMSPDLEAAYRKELDAMLHPPMTARSAAPGIVLLITLLTCTALIARTAFVPPVGPLLLTGYAILAIAFFWSSVLILRSLRTRRHSHQSVSSIAGALTAAAGVITVVALLMGLRNPSDPKSLFGAFYVFVFYFACAIWALENRIKSAELSSREQSLRIEYRLAELSEHLAK